MYVGDAQGLAVAFARLLGRAGAVVAVHSAPLPLEATAPGQKLQGAIPTPQPWHPFYPGTPSLPKICCCCWGKSSSVLC